MHTVLRERIMRRLETLPDDQAYQVLDYIEFLEAKYAESELRKEASGLQRFGERLEDSLRKRTVSPGVLREAFQVIAAADRVLSGVASAGKDLLGELDGSSRPGSGSGATSGSGVTSGPRPNADPTSGSGTTSGSGSDSSPASGRRGEESDAPEKGRRAPTDRVTGGGTRS